MAKMENSRLTPDVPARSLPKFEAITALTDAFCKEYLNEEYATLCRQLAAVLAWKRPTPLRRGKEEVWACGIVRTIAWVNMLDDPSGCPHMKLIDIDPRFGVAVERIGQLMQSVTEEMERSRDWHVAGRLESAYEEVKRLVDELANPHGSGDSGTSPDQEADASV